MRNEKAYQRDQLIYEFGILVQPFEDLNKQSSPPTLSEYRIAIAKVQAGDTYWRSNVREFTTFANDLKFAQENRYISHVPEGFWSKLTRLINDPGYSSNLSDLHTRYRAELKDMKNKFWECVNMILIEWEPVIFEANTPFTSYLRIKESIAIVNDRLHYFDRYLKEDFFHLFLNFLNNSISVRLVTTEGNNNYGITNVVHISNLACQEFKDYQLIEIDPKELHDRNLRVDNKIFNLGPGVDRAGMALTNFGPADSTEDAHDKLDTIIGKGRIIHS